MATEIFQARPYQEFAIKKIIENPFIGLFLDMDSAKRL